ncbi:hypothetical protein IGI04_036104 [Brassica rapa subsp. trilocularis]|uniref:Retrotransposon gag domain-containing protein n=1 Tax=Brassica rapa subsp. trilocularis TaxID=1813537 RepID=A0ABQ7LDI8_BRACM|nr:hypothetical protein IGI04_036104 [Brassica rapa subsp. trilocularis]
MRRDWGSDDPFYGLPHEDPKDLIKRLEELASANKHDEISAGHIICKIFPYCLSRDAFSWFSMLQPRSLTCWEDIKCAFLGKFFSEAVVTRSRRFDYMVDKMIEDHEKGIITSLSQISISQIMDFAYSEQDEDFEIPTIHVKQPDIQVHHADKREQSKVEEADTKDPTSASIYSSNSESIDIRTSETIDTNIFHRSIPSTISDATTVYVMTGRPKAIRDYNSPEDAYAKRSALRRSALQNTVLELHTAYISLVGQHSFHGFPHEDRTFHLETFVDMASTIICNGVSEDYYLCKLFSYSLAGEAAYWFRKYAFLNKFLYDAAANLEIEIRSMLEYMVEDDEQHESGKLSTVEVADISDMSSSSIDTLTITSIITPTSSCPQDIANSTQESIDESSCDLTSGVDKVTLKDFLELEEWFWQKLDDQPASGKGLENSLKADDIDRYKPDEIDRHPPYDIDLQSPSNIDQHTPDCIARYLPDCIDRHPCLDELSGYMIEPELVGRKEHTSGASHLAVPENLRPPLCKEEDVGICKRVKRIHDPVKIMVPCAVFEVESPIPPDKGVYLSSYIEVFNDKHHVEASQKGLRFRDEGPAKAPSNNISKSELSDTKTSSSIDTDQIPSIDTLRVSEQNELEVCQHPFNGGTTTRSDKSGGKKWKNWKKRKRINEGSQLSLIPHFSVPGNPEWDYTSLWERRGEIGRSGNEPKEVLNYH